MAAEMLAITTKSRAEAECIARELEEFGSCLGETSTVTVPRSSKLADVLSALETCLGKNGIDAVSISVDGRKYVMEPAP